MIVVIFNLPGLAIAFGSVVAAALLQGLFEITPLLDWMGVGGIAKHNFNIIFLAWGVLGAAADVVLRIKLGGTRFGRLFSSASGGSLWFVPCWIWGALFTFMGLNILLRSAFFVLGAKRTIITAVAVVALAVVSVVSMVVWGRERVVDEPQVEGATGDF